MAKARKIAKSRSGEKVGRGNPPKHTRFVKGESGNKKGRPRGSKNLATLVMEAARDQVTATIGGQVRKISKLQATTMQLATKAASGDQSSMIKFLDRVDQIEMRATAERRTEFPLTDADVDVLRAIYERMKQCIVETKGT